jgi:NADH-quinone oxidoreductase subunit L
MGVVKQELKQVLAYSTISQYGYMMLALGGGGYVAAVFHLTTHAVFKALLFLGAGSVIIAMHHNENMWDMGGLKDNMRVTYLTFLSGSLALAGIVPFAGFWSKDEVLYETLVHGLGGAPLLLLGYAMGLIAVFFTGFYTFRMVFLTFHGDPRTDQAADPQPVRWNVKFPLAVLGIGAAVVGFVNMGVLKDVIGDANLFLHVWLDGGLDGLNAHHYADVLHDVAGYTTASLSPFVAGAASLGLAVVGVLAAYRLYAVPEPTPHLERLGRIRTIVMHNYYQDEYQVWLATGVTAPLARAADTFDQGVIDGVVNGVSSVSLFIGERFRRIQSGVVTNYAALLTIAFVILLAYFAYVGGWF